MEQDDQCRVLVIDEMNRANLSRVFGELMYLFEYRGASIELQYSKDFTLPKSLFFIGTMNTADRSIRTIDIALRRRFDVFPCWPDEDILGRYFSSDQHQNDVTNLQEGFRTLNEKLTEQLDRHHTIGHTFFMQEHLTRDRLKGIWERKIGPLIEEYFFDQPDRAREFSLKHFWPESYDVQVKYLVETREQVIAMSDGQADELRAVGKRLAKMWWGAEEASTEHSVLRCNPKGPGEWFVHVNDAIGMIAIEGLQLIVKPKIPIPHLLYLFAESGRFPRLDTERRIQASAGESLLELVVEWFVTAMETVLRRGLIRDYHDTTESIPFVRGRLDVPDTTRTHLLGRTSFLCHFEEFGFDTPLNRVLKAACQIVMTNQIVRPDVRARATRIANRLDRSREPASLGYTEFSRAQERSLSRRLPPCEACDPGMRTLS